MTRVACALLLVGTVSVSARGADLPPGALARLGDDRFRAGSRVEHLALSPDGTQFATVRRGPALNVVVAVWDAPTGRIRHAREANAELFRGVVWGPGGASAVVTRAELGRRADEPGRVFPDDFHVWDFADAKAEPPPALAPNANGNVLFTEQPKSRPQYTDFRFSADGRRVAARWESADGRRAVHVFDLKPTASAEKLTQVGALDLGAQAADDMRLSADGRTVVTIWRLSHAEIAATAWDVATGRPARPVLAPADGWPWLTPDARALIVHVVGDDEWGFDRFDLATGKRRELARWRVPKDAHALGGPNLGLGGFAFTPSGREFVAAVGRQTFVIDLATGKELGRFEGHADELTALAVSADGRTIATADASGLVRLWDAKAYRPLNEAAGHRAPVEHAELSPDGKRLLTWAGDETARLWDLGTGNELRAFANATRPHTGFGWFPRRADRPTFTPDGTAIICSTKDRLTARDLLTGLEVPLPGGMAKLEPRIAVFAPDGKSVLTWTGETQTVTEFEVWTWPSGEKRFGKFHRKDPFAPGFSPDGEVVYASVTGPDRWDAKTGKALPPQENRAGPLELLRSLRPNPRWLLHDARDTVRVIAAGTGEPVERFRFARGTDVKLPKGDYAVCPTGGQFASESSDEVLLCESATCAVRRTLGGHRGRVRVLGFTPDGTKLLTAGGDHTVLVWDTRLQSVPLPDALKKETNAAKLWDTLVTGKADAAYLAMARLGREPGAAVKLAQMRLKPVAKGHSDTDASKIADCRAVELLDALGTDESRALLEELAGGHPDAFRTQEAKRALERNKR